MTYAQLAEKSVLAFIITTFLNRIVILTYTTLLQVIRFNDEKIDGFVHDLELLFIIANDHYMAKIL